MKQKISGDIIKIFFVTSKWMYLEITQVPMTFFGSWERRNPKNPIINSSLRFSGKYVIPKPAITGI